MKTESEIMSAPAKEVAKVLTAFNQWRRGVDERRKDRSFLDEYGARGLGLYIDRAIILLEDMNKLQKTIKRKKGNANERKNHNKMSNKKGKRK